MKLYTVHFRQEVSGSPDGLADGVRLVKEGFSWPALSFPVLWTIAKGMWLVLIAVVAARILIAAGSIGLNMSAGAALMLNILVNIFMGLQGNDLYRWTLRRRRYEERAVVSGGNRSEAEERFFAKALASLNHHATGTHA